MAQLIGSAVSGEIIQLLTRSGGVNAALAALVATGSAPPPSLDAAQIRVQNVAPDLMERGKR